MGRDFERGVRIPATGVILDGDLLVPRAASGVVVFAHGSGSSRHSPRNRSVAASFQADGYATLLMDLLTPEEGLIDGRTRQYRFDISRLASRLAELTGESLTSTRKPRSERAIQDCSRSERIVSWNRSPRSSGSV